MLSLLGIEMALGSHIIKPFYLILGVLSFIGLFSLLMILYGYLLVKKVLQDTINNIKTERKRYSNKR
jgi:hypothetical protein